MRKDSMFGIIFTIVITVGFIAIIPFIEQNNSYLDHGGCGYDFGFDESCPEPTKQQSYPSVGGIEN